MAGQEPMTFGVELEMAVACLFEGDTNPWPSETRNLRFDSTTTKSTMPVSPGLQGFVNDQLIIAQIALQHHMRRVLKQAGVPVIMKAGDEKGEYKNWEVTTDPTIRGRDEEQELEGDDATGYRWLKIELISPVLPLTQESIDQVQLVCDTIQSNYCIYTGSSTGLHVHVGRGKLGFEDQHIRNLSAFAWAFEPQLSTIIGQERIDDNEYLTDIRSRSRYADKFYRKYGRQPVPIVAVQHFLASIEFRTLDQIKKSFSVIEWIAKQAGIDKNKALNLSNASNFAQGFPSTKPTVEWRAHKGTVTGHEVTNWIKAVVGMTQFACYAYPIDFHNLLLMVENEKWQKTGVTDQDTSNESLYGPILAEFDFTVIDLFRTLGLDDSAKYYADKLEEIVPMTKPRTKEDQKFIIWRHEADPRDSDDLEDLNLRKDYFMAFWEAKLHNSSPPLFDESSPFWPEHTWLKEMDENTDAS